MFSETKVTEIYRIADDFSKEKNVKRINSVVNNLINHI